jgi:taurine dioxygenase
LDADAADALREMLARHKLLLFRGVEVDAAQQRRLLERFGTVIDEKEDGRYYSLVNNRISPDSDEGDECTYHCDYSFKPSLLPFVSLYGLEIPEGCAPTRFVNGIHAYRGLDADLKSRLEGRLVLHACDVTSASAESAGPLRPDDLETKSYLGTLHPAILSHPSTGEPILFINDYLCVRIEGVSNAESAALLAGVSAHLYAEDAVYEHSWRPGDLMIFDNIALQHKRVKGAPRVLRRMIVR